jgi:hypothetical protein
MTSFLRAGTVVLAGAVASACVVNVESQSQVIRDEKRFTVTGTPEVRLSTFDGAIEVQSWDRPDVVIEIEKRGPTREAIEALSIETSQKGNRIQLEAKRKNEESFHGFGFNVSTSVRLIVSVPRRTDLIARTGDGAIKLQRVNGRIELRTADGAITVSDVSGELTFETGDGSVTVDGAEGRLALETGDGGVNVVGQLSAVKMHTGDGSIVYRIEPGASMSDEWDISTGDGSVSLYIPRGFNASLDAHTGDGSIRFDDGTVRDSERGDDRRTLRGRIGDGGKRLRVRTGDGAILLKDR